MRRRITRKRLMELVSYDPATGIFTSRVLRPPWIKGQEVGNLSGDGYIRITLDYRSYKAHRLAIFYMTGRWPPDEGDHRNGKRADNRWVNIRPATRSQNAMNTKVQSNNKSGFKGVCWCPERQNWRVTIQGRQIGRLPTKEAAIALRAQKEQELFGEFRRV